MEKQFSLISTNGKTSLAVYVWEAKQPVAVLQLIHGMAEYAERYEPFIQALNNANITVIAHDHVGHGSSIDPQHPEYGYIADVNPENVILEDIHHVANIVKQAYPDLPFFAFGHSMGSFALRNVIACYPHLYDAVIFMGSGYFQAGLLVGLPLLDVINRLQPHYVNQWVNSLTFGFYPLHYKNEKYDRLSWLSRDMNNRQNVDRDPRLGFAFTNNGFYTLFHLVAHANTPSWFQHYPKALPTLFLSGEEDPIGGFGHGITKVVKRLKEEGVNHLDFYLYPKARHELLNEAIASDVTHDILTWISKNLDQTKIHL